MNKYKSFEKFAPSLLKTYRRNEEAFWQAILAPFLNTKASLFDWFSHLSIDVQLLSAISGLDKNARHLLEAFSAPMGFDITEWESNRDQYLKDAYPVFSFLVIWLYENELTELIEQFDKILQAGVYAVAGYGILDENVDGAQSSPVQILTAQALIAEYEYLALQVFGITSENLQIMHKMRTLFLEVEIKEKACRGIKSPYQITVPEQLGAKGANAVAPFMLSLEKLGKSHLIDQYWQVFLYFGAAIQMMDDWEDLEKDLSAGHYSFITLGYEEKRSGDPAEAASFLRNEKGHVTNTLQIAMDMIKQAKDILTQLNDDILVQLVDITEIQVKRFYEKTFAIEIL